MTEPFILRSFTGGVISPALRSRVDLQKYEQAVAQAENFYVDYAGGLVSRAGTEFCAQLGDEDVRLFEFELLGDQDSVVVVVRSAGGFIVAGSIRLMQNGEFLEDGGSPINISHTFPTDRLAELKAYQIGLDLYFTHPAVRPHRLSLFSDTGAWTFGPVNFLSATNAKANAGSFTQAEIDAQEAALFAALANRFNMTLAVSSVNPTDTSASVLFTITTVNNLGVESNACRPGLFTGIPNYSTESGAGKLVWDAVPGVTAYRIYRSNITGNNIALDASQPLGFVGEVTTPSLIDTNIAPDFSRQPPVRYDPFARGAVLAIEVINGGSGYTAGDSCTVAGVGINANGFIGYPVVTDGSVVGIVIMQQGAFYRKDDPVVFSTSGGTGATAKVISVAPVSGTAPRAMSRFFQHSIFAGSDSVPGGLWGSTRGTVEAFSTARTVDAASSYFEVVDTVDASAIENLVPLRDGLLIFHPKGIERLTENSNGRQVLRQAGLKTAQITPLVVNDDIVFALRDNTGIQALVFTFYANSYSPQDLTSLASHYFSVDNPIRALSWQTEPNKQLLVAQENGELLALTYLREQEIFGWTRYRTQGRFMETLAVAEGRTATTYVAAKRFLNGSFVTTIERFKRRKTAPQQAYWGVDCALAYAGTPFAQDVTLVRLADGRYEASLSSLAFPDIDERFLLRDTLYRVVERTPIFSPFDGVTIIGYTPILELEVGEVEPPEMKQGRAFYDRSQCSVREAVTTLSGLSHLNGLTVSVQADGDALLDVPVVDGSITIPNPSYRIIAGLPYECLVETLPIASTQVETDSRDKRIVGTAVRLSETRGLEAGTSPSHLYEVKDRSYEDYGQATELRSDNMTILHTARWEKDATLFIQQRYPLPAAVLGLVIKAEVEQ